MRHQFVERTPLPLRERLLRHAIQHSHLRITCARTRERQDDAINIWHRGVGHFKLHAEQRGKLRRLRGADEAHRARERPFINECKAAQPKLHGARNERFRCCGGAQEAEGRLRMQLGKGNLGRAISHRCAQGTSRQRGDRGRSAPASRVR